MRGRRGSIPSDVVRELRRWDALRKSIPTRKQVRERLGISDSLLGALLRGAIYKGVRP